MNILDALKWANVWKAVNRSAATTANEAMRQSLVPASGTAGNVSRNDVGQFATLRTGTDSNKAMQWFRKITDPTKRFDIAKSWAPFQAPVIGSLGGNNPTLQLEVRPMEYSRVTLDDPTVNLVTDAITDALIEDTSWIGPIVNDAINPGSYYDYGTCA